MYSMLIGSTLAALATGLGAIPILFFKQLTHRWKDSLLAFTAGVMLSASFMGLIPQALELSNVFVVSLGIILGTFAMNTLEKYIPHMDLEHSTKKIRLDNKSLLIISALTLHNIPEGLSTGLSYASSNETLGPLIALAIASQNAPEGLLIALYLLNNGNMNKWSAVGIATVTGLIEIIASTLGYFTASFTENLVPYGLSFAGAAMIFIVAKELLPETQGDGHEVTSTYSLVIGILFMLFLINVF